MTNLQTVRARIAALFRKTWVRVLTALTLWLGAAFYGYGFTLAVLITLVTALGILDYKLNHLEYETFMLQ